MLGLGAMALLVTVLVAPREKISPQAVPSPTLAPSPQPRTADVAPSEPLIATRRPGHPAVSGTGAPAAEVDAQARAEAHEDRVAARTAELRELSRKTDPRSWETLVAELRNSDAEIRAAALDIISQSGNRNAIPALVAAAAATEDAREKQAIADAIEFLQLPTLTEVLNGAGPKGGAAEKTSPAGR